MSGEKNPRNTDSAVKPAERFEKLFDMPLTTRLILGGCRMEIASILKLGQGSIIELETDAGGLLEIRVNDQLLAKARAVVSKDKIGAQIVEIVSTEERIKDFALTEDQ